GGKRLSAVLRLAEVDAGTENVGVVHRIDPDPAEPPAIGRLRTREISVVRQLRPGISAIVGTVKTLEQTVGRNDQSIETQRIGWRDPNPDWTNGGTRGGQSIR